MPVLTVLIVGSFLFWSLPAMVGNTFMPMRTVFAWAFDRLLPEKLADVNERTHSPVPAILTVMVLVTVMLDLERRWRRPSRPGWRSACWPASSAS